MNVAAVRCAASVVEANPQPRQSVVGEHVAHVPETQAVATVSALVDFEAILIISLPTQQLVGNAVNKAALTTLIVIAVAVSAPSSVVLTASFATSRFASASSAPGKFAVLGFWANAAAA